MPNSTSWVGITEDTGKGREMGEMVLQKIPARVERWERWYYRRYRQG